MTRFNWVISLSIFVIASMGLLSLWGITPDLFWQQLISVILGFIFFIIFSFVDFRVFKSLAGLFYIGSLIFLILTFVLGEITRGSVRWINLGFISIQPSEVVKPLLIIVFAYLWSLPSEKSSVKRLLLSIVLLGIPAFLIFKQPDLGSSLVLGVSILAIILAAEFSYLKVFITTLIFLILSPLTWFFLKDYQKDRIITFLNPSSDPTGAGYNVLQAVIAVGSGQFWGRGLGRGTQSQLSFLPEHHTDFIFASFTEEFGFIGAFILLILFALLLFYILKISKDSSDEFGSLLAIGVFGMLLFQIFVNVGMNMGIVPITGVTLPLVSYGGSSIISIMTCLGMVNSVYINSQKEKVIQIH